MTEESNPSRQKDLVWNVLVCVALLAMITVNALANILPINGVSTAEVSNGYPIYFVPAGYVFSIWGLIYLALIVFAVAQAFSTTLGAAATPVRPLFVLSCVANGAWIFCWHHYQLALSVAVMIMLLTTLVTIYQRLWDAAGSTPSALLRWTVLGPIGLYMAWICVATIPNISALLLTLGWDGAPLTGPLWAAVMMVVAALIIAALARRFADAIPPLVLGWALIGIVVKFPDQSLMRTVGILVTVAMIGVAFSLIFRRRQPVIVS